jgi:hypothetical protein
MRKISSVYRLLALLAVAQVVGSAEVRAHEWYPHECCDENDCAVVISMEGWPDGIRRLETKHGVVFVPRGYEARPSPDGKAHACMKKVGPESAPQGFEILCLFLPAIS